MDFETPQDYADALKRLEGFPLMGMEVRDGHLFFNSLSSHVALPLSRVNGWWYLVVRYGLNMLDVLIDHVNYNAHFRQVLLFDEKSDVIAQVELKNLTRKEWLLGELYGKRLRSSMNVNPHKRYVRLTDGVVFTGEADGLTGVFMHWTSLDSPVDHIIDQGDSIYIMTENGGAIELLFKDGDGDDED